MKTEGKQTQRYTGIMAKEVKPLDADEATLQIDPEIAGYFAKGAARAHGVEKFGFHPGRQSRRVSFVIQLRRDGSKELQKHPIALRLSSRDARQISKQLKQAADAADGIQ